MHSTDAAGCLVNQEPSFVHLEETPVNMAKWTENPPKELQATEEELGAGGVALPRDAHSYWWARAQWAAPKTCLQIPSDGRSRLESENTCLYTTC